MVVNINEVSFPTRDQAAKTDNRYGRKAYQWLNINYNNWTFVNQVIVVEQRAGSDF